MAYSTPSASSPNPSRTPSPVQDENRPHSPSASLSVEEMASLVPEEAIRPPSVGFFQRLTMFLSRSFRRANSASDQGAVSHSQSKVDLSDMDVDSLSQMINFYSYQHTQLLQEANEQEDPLCQMAIFGDASRLAANIRILQTELETRNVQPACAVTAVEDNLPDTSEDVSSSSSISLAMELEGTTRDETDVDLESFVEIDLDEAEAPLTTPAEAEEASLEEEPSTSRLSRALEGIRRRLSLTESRGTFIRSSSLPNLAEPARPLSPFRGLFSTGRLRFSRPAPTMEELTAQFETVKAALIREEGALEQAQRQRNHARRVVNRIESELRATRGLATRADKNLMRERLKIAKGQLAIDESVLVTAQSRVRTYQKTYDKTVMACRKAGVTISFSEA